MDTVNLHLVQYAKGHYGYSDDVMEDLKVLVSKWSGIGHEGIAP